MSLTRCPHCGNPLTAEERFLTSCPACGKSLTDAIRAGPPEKENVWERTERPSSWEKPGPRTVDPLKWGSVRTGLTLVAAGFVLLLAGFVLLCVFLPAMDSEEPRMGLEVLVQLLGIITFVGAVQCVTGMCMGGTVPGESSAQGWIQGFFFTLLGASVVLVILLVDRAQNRADFLRQQKKVFDQHFGREGDNPLRAEPEPPGSATELKVLGYLLQGIGLLGSFFYLGFLWAVARYFHNTGLAVSLVIYMLASLLSQIMVFLLLAVRETPQGATTLANLFSSKGWQWGTIAWVVTFGLWFWVQVLLVRSTVCRAMVRRGY
jgi:hypothetical protein